MEWRGELWTLTNERRGGKGDTRGEERRVEEGERV